MSILLLVLALISVSFSLAPRRTSARDLFSQWKRQYNKSYETKQEEELRFSNFQKSLERVKQLSVRRNVAGGAKFGLTLFSGVLVEIVSFL